MITSILEHILNYKDASGLQFQVQLRAINCFIFDELFAVFTEQEAKQAVLYLLYAYSQESPLLIVSADPVKEKEGICKIVDIPEYWADKLKALSEPAIVKCLNDYLNDYASTEWRNLMQMKTQYIMIQNMISAKEFNNGEGVFDAAAWLKAITVGTTLAKQITAYEVALKGRTHYLHLAQKEVKEAGKKHARRRANVEASAEIIRK